MFGCCCSPVFCVVLFLLSIFLFFFVFGARRSHLISSDSYGALFHCLPCYGALTEAVDLNELEHGELKSRLKCGAISSVHWSAGVLLFVL